ncbi:TPA: hypothetical protein ACTYSP_004290 [Citrobacter freundii]
MTMKYKTIVILLSLASCNVYSATAIHLSGNKTTTYVINMFSAANGVSTSDGQTFFSTKTNTRVRGGTSPIISTQFGMSNIESLPYSALTRGEMRYGINSTYLGFLFYAKNATTAPLGQSVWVTYSGPDSDKGLESQCMTNNINTVYTYVTVGGVVFRCENNVYPPRVNVNHQSMTVNYANTWSGLYEQNLTLNPGQRAKVLWGTAGNTTAMITSTLSGAGMNDVKLSGDCNGRISPSGQCSVTANNHTWFGTRTANLNITIRLP